MLAPLQNVQVQGEMRAGEVGGAELNTTPAETSAAIQQPHLNSTAPPVEDARSRVSHILSHPQQQQSTEAMQASENEAQSAVPTVTPAEEVPIEDLVNGTIICLEKPLENVPSITPPELKLIGRCVSFLGTTSVSSSETRSFYYEGLVATINKDTVMLIHVNRYTEEDHKAHRRENTSSGPSAVESKTLLPEGDKTDEMDSGREVLEQRETNEPCGFNEQSSNGERHVSLEKQCECNESPAEQLDGEEIGKASTFAVFPLQDASETHAETTIRVRNRMRGHNGTMGPIPYITISRSRINHVEFGQDPHSSFYSLFHDPTKAHFDMQCLRMFVRRYLVHTAQGNNPRQVSLRTFITSRCNCPNLDNDLLVQTTREELAHLIKIDRDIKRVKKRKEQNRRNVLRMYRAPNGLFRLTGVLYLTHIPRQTFIIGLLELVTLTAVTIYSSVLQTTSSFYVIWPYLYSTNRYLFASIVVCTGAIIFTIMHSVRMALPLQSMPFLIVLRCFSVLGGITISLMFLMNVAKLLSPKRMLNFLMTYKPGNICQYYRINNCSGFKESCNSLNIGTIYYSHLCQCNFEEYSNVACQSSIIPAINRPLIPLICFLFVLFFLFMFDMYLCYRLLYVGRLLERRM